MVHGHTTAAEQGVRVLSFGREGFQELFLTASGPGRLDVSGAVRHLGLEGGCAGAVARAEMFVPTGAKELSRAGCLAPVQEPFAVTCVIGESAQNGHLGGVHLHAVTGRSLRPVELAGRVVGTVVETPYATECLLGDIRPATPCGSRVQQARATFEMMQEALQCVGMQFSNVVRTWLFLDDILSWYNEFNQVRTTFFTEHDIFEQLVPASTGIGGSNPAGTAMVTSVFAVKPKTDQVLVQAVPSPLQCPALEYGSSFSRAAEVAMPDHRRLFVSGTASIDPEGNTVHVGDVQGQVARTCEVVQAILQSRAMEWRDVTRATAYVRHPQDAPIFHRYCADSGIPALPVIIANNTICRDDLLFELEVDAITASPAP